MRLLATADLHKRWTADYHRDSIRKITARDDFPAPVDVVENGRTPIWNEDDVAAFEKDRPWLFSEKEKRARQRGFLRAVRKGNRQ